MKMYKQLTLLIFSYLILISPISAKSSDEKRDPRFRGNDMPKSLSSYTDQKISNGYIFNPLDSAHTLYKPNGNGPFPALLLLHASTGVVKVNHDWATRLRDHGYVVYIIDSFKPRGWVDRAAVGWEKATAAQLADVTPAYKYLSQLPFVDAKRIGILGFSMGGFDVLRVREGTSAPAEFQKLPFKVAASFYGVCHRLTPNAKLTGPTKIFIGTEDDRGTTQDCFNLVKHSNNQSVTMQTYNDALHGFDNFEFPARKEVIDEKGEHYHIGYNEAARKKSLEDLPKFLDKYLK